VASSSKSTSRQSDGQTFLVGPTLYLRGIESDDANVGTAWYPSSYPIPPDILEDRLKESVPDDARDSKYRLVACRRGDDVPVGSVWFRVDGGRTAEFTVYANPLYREDVRAEIGAELIRLMVPYLLMERDVMVVWFDTEAGIPLIEETLATVRMRKAYRLREAMLFGGRRRDLACYEILHPNWVARLGSPEVYEEGAVEREVRSPAPRTFPELDGEPPANAIKVGERVYLRAVVDDDADEFVYWGNREPETFFDNGRPLRSPVSVKGFHKKLAEEDAPEWVRFAICLRENDEIIGSNGIDGIDLVHGNAETETDLFRAEYRNGGYGTEAKHLLLSYAFETLGLHMVRSFAWQFNTRSAAALRKQGYRDAGSLSWSGQKDGDLTGDFVFDLLASEWQAARR
jgi:RimJ/RimL family protein N-acetyltransferase